TSCSHSGACVRRSSVALFVAARLPTRKSLVSGYRYYGTTTHDPRTTEIIRRTTDNGSLGKLAFRQGIFSCTALRFDCPLLGSLPVLKCKPLSLAYARAGYSRRFRSPGSTTSRTDC